MIYVNSIHDSCTWTPLFHFNNDVTFPFIWPLGNLLLPSVPTVQIDRLINEKKTCDVKIKYWTRVILLEYFNFHINIPNKDKTALYNILCLYLWEMECWVFNLNVLDWTPTIWRILYSLHSKSFDGITNIILLRV